MARTGQVVYFTHHHDLCEIAKAVEPATIIHHLSFRCARPGQEQDGVTEPERVAWSAVEKG
jgi:hypothetical protein